MFSLKCTISSIFMLFTLAWLTVSTPFVYADQQMRKELAKEQKGDVLPVEESEEAPLSNATEEKGESGVNSLSEYLHDTHDSEHPEGTIVKYYKCHPSDLYFAFHPELLSPPPEA